MHLYFNPNLIYSLSRSIFGMGGLGGMGGMGGFPGGMFGGQDDDDMHSHFFGGGGMPGGMPNGRSQTRGGRARQESAPTPSTPSEITRPLKVSLEDLYSGTTKRLKVGRKLLNGTTEDKVLEIQVHPGWKSGTKIRFPKAGNEQLSGDAQDLVFVVEEKPHDRFQRQDNNLITSVKLPLVDALVGDGGKRVVETLDGRKLQIPVPSGIVKPTSTTTISGEGMPIRKEGSVKKKGDLIVKWDVVFPDRLTPSQKEGIRKVLS
jgi:DnaJ homolog subfamily B member 4